VRAGSIVPLGPVRQHDRDRSGEDTITLLIHPAGRSSFTLYEDDGETNTGGHALTEFTCVEDTGNCVVTIGPPQGDAAQIPKSRSYTLQVFCPHRPRSVTLDGAPVPHQHDGTSFLFIHLGGAPARVEMHP
jgi:hypothetical protein